MEEAEEHLAHVRRWRERVEQEVAAFRGVAGRFRDLLDADLCRAEDQLNGIVSGLEAARRVQAPDAGLECRIDTHVRTPLWNESEAYVDALHRLMELLVAAERDTEY